MRGPDDAAQAPPLPKADPPAEFGEYRLGREIGRGASGRVYECRRRPGGGEVLAVKALHLRGMKLMRHGERTKQRLQRELAILRSLPPHPRIVKMVDSLEDEDWFFLVLELVAGGDLFGVRRPLLEREASFVFWQLTEGLDFLHRQGVVHRDLKLENVLVASQRREGPHVLYDVKISDFGLSKSIGLGQAGHSSVGTMRYAAPEVLEGTGSYDFRADLWSLGVLVYVLLQGSYLPHEQPQHLPQQALNSLVDGTRWSSAARDIVRGVLQLDPARRLSLQALGELTWSGGAEPGGAGEGAAAAEPGPFSVRGSSSTWGSRSLFGSEDHVLPPPAPGATPSCSAAGSLLTLQAFSDRQRQGSPARGAQTSGRLASSLLPFADAVLAAAADDGWPREEDARGDAADLQDDGGAPGGPPEAKRARAS